MRGDLLRKINEAALIAGRKRKSMQTGFLHLHYHMKDDQPELTIPILENFLYAWTLLRSRTAENILEAKNHLEKLLPFQTDQGFPLYLHDYPQVKDRVLSFHLLGVFAGIIDGFKTVLGSELKGRLEQGSEELWKNCQEALQDFNVPFPAQVRAACAAKLLKLSNGEDHLKSLVNLSWHTTEDLGVIVAALYTVYPSLVGTPWEDFWEKLRSNWHVSTQSYIGEVKQEYQFGFEPQATLLDLVMGIYYEKLSKRAVAETPHLLQAPWVPLICEEVAAVDEVPFSLMINPFRCHWGNIERAHTLACLGGNARAVHYAHQGKEVEIVFELDTLPDTDDKEKLREVVFYLDHADVHQVRFSGTSSTTFQLDNPVEIISGSFSAKLQFSVLEGSGQWMGHLMRGNRPNQLAAKGANRFQSYDWQIILRTLRRTTPCKIACRISLDAI